MENNNENTVMPLFSDVDSLVCKAGHPSSKRDTKELKGVQGRVMKMIKSLKETLL